MTLADEDIVKFQTLYKSKFGICLSKEDALQLGAALLRLTKIVCTKHREHLASA
jgi:hypothetical protein